MNRELNNEEKEKLKKITNLDPEVVKTDEETITIYDTEDQIPVLQYPYSILEDDRQKA